jgi:hypothetical protein
MGAANAAETIVKLEHENKKPELGALVHFDI